MAIMNSMLKLVGREQALLAEDVTRHEPQITAQVSQSRFLVLGGAGTIGQAVVREIFSRKPITLHVVDISENNLAELVRDIRSSFGYIEGDFRTFALDIGSVEFGAFFAADGRYDYVLNLSALKHVRSEEDPYTLMRMIDVNILNTEKTLLQAIDAGVKKYFCVSTDKAAAPVNMMGASKRIMEMFLMRHSEQITISTARFANVAFSDGSLLHSFKQRLEKQQPIVAPNDILRYFITPQESGQLCLMSCLFGENRDIFFPKLNPDQHLMSFSDIGMAYLRQQGFEPFICTSEQQARDLASKLIADGTWPCYFSASDTTGEKVEEEFFSEGETLDMERFANLGVICNKAHSPVALLNFFSEAIAEMRAQKKWNKNQLVELFNNTLSDFSHRETGKYLDGKM